jgi:hypothetical protein
LFKVALSTINNTTTKHKINKQTKKSKNKEKEQAMKVPCDRE